jgi:hypothetical protein
MLTSQIQLSFFYSIKLRWRRSNKFRRKLHFLNMPISSPAERVLEDPVT